MAYSQLLPLAKGMALMHNYVSGQPSKFHFEASFVNSSLHLLSFVAWVFFLVLLSWEFVYAKLCYLTISK